MPAQRLQFQDPHCEGPPMETRPLLTPPFAD